MYMKLKDYEILGELYSGLRSKIYKGKRISDGYPIVLKIMNAECPNSEDIKAFQREFEIGSRINSNNVIKYIEIVKINHSLGIVEEYFSGETIDKFNKVNLKEFLSIAIGICNALKKIQAKNIVHGAINPSNILYDGITGEVKIIDFSNAKCLQNESYIDENNNIFQSCLNYISPEQTGRTNRSMDYRSDFYSLGITFYEMLTGRLPFKSEDTMGLIYSHVAKQPESITTLTSDIPEVVSNIVLKLIAKNPEERYKSASGLKRDLEKCVIAMENNESMNFELGKYDFSGEFCIPQKLYGREKEIKELIESFDRIREGSAQILLIAGSPGVGKSALVNEISDSIKQKNGYFLFGKFEQFQNDIPYSTIIQSLDKFIKQLLVEPSSELKKWKERILKCVGNNGQVIIDVIPTLELIIGKQPEVPQLGAIETQNRFNLVFGNFMKIIATEEHPLVMFIDDLQWADSASLNFMKMMMMDKSNKYLLVIGAYRDNDPNLLRPIMSWMYEIIQGGTKIKTIDLKVIERKDIKLLLQDTLVGLEQDLSDIEELSDCIYSKTQGNPFFVKQFLRSLYDFKHLWFEYNLMKWCFNTEEIRKMNITENVIDLLDSKIKMLKPSAIEYLKYGACMGNEFDLKTLVLVNDKNGESILNSLKEAVKIGLIYDLHNNRESDLMKADIKFKFVHDRVQQAVYSIISDDEKCSIHLQLGQLYLKNYAEFNKSEQLFETVRQLNAGSIIITDKFEKVKLAELNLKAGIAAKQSSAYYSAYTYFNEGIKLLANSNGWQEFYDITLQLYSEITEASYLISNYNKMDKFAAVVLENAKTLMDKVNVYRVKIEASQAQLNVQEALDTALSVLKLMGIDIKANPTKEDVDEVFEEVWNIVKEIKPENLVKLPEMKDEVMLGAMQILLGSTSAAYKIAPMVMNIAVCKMVELSIKFGDSPFSPGAYSLYGLALCSYITNIELGDKLEEYIDLAYKLGKINVDIVEKPNMKPSKVIVLDVNNSSVNEWKESLRDTLKPLMDGYLAGIENGNFEYAGYCLMNYNKHSLYSGKELNIVEDDIKKNIIKLQKIKQGFSVNWVFIFGQIVQNIQGKSKDPIKLTGDFCDEDEMILILEDIGDMLGLVFLYLGKMRVNYIFGSYFSAIQYGKKVEENLAGASATIDIAVYYFYDSLSRLAVHFTLAKEEQIANLTRIRKNQELIKAWAKLAPMNFMHKFYLVQAELCKVTGNFNEARECYDKSIKLARENEYLNDEALAYELAGKFYLDECRRDMAKVYLVEAKNKYQLWGAIAKVNEMKNRYPSLMEETDDNLNAAQSMDLFSIMKASQAISSEINLEGLLVRLMTVILENMGAQRGFLILKSHDTLVIEAYVDAVRNKKEILTLQPLDEFEELPKTVIRFTARTGENVIFPEKTDKFLFDEDPYIINKKPKSFFSTAVKIKNTIKGVLYLENNLVEGAFKPDRVKVIDILSTQAAISLENAILYNTLEENMNDKLRDSENKLRFTVTNAGLGLWEWDIETGEIKINEEWASMVGYTLDELKLQNIDMFFEIMHPDDIVKSKECLKRCFSKELDVYECEFRIKHKNGEWVWILGTGRVMEWDTSNKPIKMSGIHMNISERKVVENELKMAKKAVEEVSLLKRKFLSDLPNEDRSSNNIDNKIKNIPIMTNKTNEIDKTNTILEEVNAIIKDEIQKYGKTEVELIRAKAEANKANLDKTNFIANISHELRTPIAVILSGIQLIEANIKNNSVENNANLFNHIKTIKQNCYRLLRLVNNIIDITKIDARLKKLELKNLNIINLIENVTTSVIKYAELKEITVLFDTDEEERIIAVDSDKIEKSLLNLLSNAIKFTPKNGYIFVKVLNENSKVIISVDDTGIGIPEEKMDIIFERFHQIDNTFTRRNEGSGIGLSIVKSFIELHGGKISVSSELGKGSKFIIEIPVKRLEEDGAEDIQTQVENASSCVDITDMEFSDIYFD